MSINFERDFLHKIEVFWSDHFLIYFFVARYLTVSLRGPVLKPYDEGASPSCDGRMGRVDGHQKGPLIFFILRYIKHFT